MFDPEHVHAGAAAPTVDTINMWSNDTHDQSVYEKVIEDFNNTTGKEKGIVVNYTVYGSDYYNALDVAVTAGEGPDIFKCNKVGKYSGAGYIMPWEEIPALQQRSLQKTARGRFTGMIWQWVMAATMVILQACL